MKAAKGHLAKLAQGDTSGLKKAAHQAAVKVSTEAGRAVSAGVFFALKGQVDEGLQAERTRLCELQNTWNALHAALKHQAERAHKTAKCLRDTNSPMVDLVSCLSNPEERRGVQLAMATEAAMAARWEAFASALESELIQPAKHECSCIFHEGDRHWAQYIALVNEIAARKTKERVTGGLAISVLNEKKLAEEVEMLPRFTALAESASAAITFLIERTRLLRTATLRETLTAVSNVGGSEEGESTMIIIATRGGWARLAAASGTATFRGSLGPDPGTASVFGAPLEDLSKRADAVGEVPLVAHLLIQRIMTGSGPSGRLLLEAEGVFRLSAEPDDVDTLKRSLDGSTATAMGAVREECDPHVLATTLKQWLRKLPISLVPDPVYKELVAIGQKAQAEGGGAPSAATIAALAALLPKLPQPNLLTLHALMEVLEAVAQHESSNRMSATNLALVFAPTLKTHSSATSAEAAGLELAVEIPAAAQAISALIKHRAQCFPAHLTSTSSADGGSDAVQPPVEVSDLRLNAPAADAPQNTTSWWYSAAGEQKGPVSGPAMTAMLSSGEVNQDTWVFESGMDDWKQLSAVMSMLP